MNKKFLSAMLFGAFAIAATSTFVSCKDYDDDINNLQEQITSNAQKIAELEKWYNAGNVITNVEKADDGRGIKVTLSNGQTYTIEGGKDGAKGEKGDTGATGAQGIQGPDGKSAYEIWIAAGNTGTEADFLASLVGPKGDDGDVVTLSNAWTIGEDGFWYINGEATTYRAIPENGLPGQQGPKGDQGDKGDKGDQGDKGDKGDKGDTGATGAKGDQGDKGDKGDYYFPGDDTYWYLVNGQTGEQTKTEYSWVGQGMTAAQTGDMVYFKNIPGGQDFAISTKLSLKSLVAKPEFYYHGIEAFDLAEINYWAKEYHKQPITSDATPDVNENWMIRGRKETPANKKYIDFKQTAEQDYSRDYEEKIENDTMEMIPDFVATYHLNPSNATVSTDPSRYAFIIENKEYTRAVDKNNVLQLNNIWKVEKVNTTNQINGINGAGSDPYDHVYSSKKGNVNKGAINVYANFRTNLEWTKKHTELIQKIAEEDAVTVIALQYKDPTAWSSSQAATDSVVTSDYAALYAARYYNLRLNLIQKYWGYTYQDHRHLHNNAAEAIASVWDEDFGLNQAYRDTTRIVNITWNNPGLDLDSIVNTHYDYWSRSTAYNDRAWDRNAADGTLKKKGLIYSYELVGWFAGSNETSESVHAALKDVDKDGNVELRPHIIRAQTPVYVNDPATVHEYGENSNGKYGRFGEQPQNLSTVGREPLVRVTLTDTINKKKVKIGYIKFHIVKTDIPDEIVQVAYEFKQPFVMACGEPEIRLDLTWSQIEAQILNVMTVKNPAFPGITKQEFMKNYKLVTNDYAPLNETDAAPAGYEWVSAAQYKVNGTPKANDEMVRPVDDHYPHPANSNAVDATYFGEVWYGHRGGSEIGIDAIEAAEGTNTDVLTWRITYNQAYQWFCHSSLRGDDQTSRTIYIRFHKVGHDQMYASGEDRMRAIEQAEDWVSIKLTWTPSKYVGPLGGKVTQNRNNNYWYRHNDGASIQDRNLGADAAHEDIHANVQTIGDRDLFDADGKTTCRFESDIIQTLIGRKFETVANSDWYNYDTYKTSSAQLNQAPYNFNTPYVGIYNWLSDARNHVNPWEQVIPANWATTKAWPRYRDVNGTDKLFDEIHLWDGTTEVTDQAIKVDAEHRGEISTSKTSDRFGNPIDNQDEPKWTRGVSLVFDITTPKVAKVENYEEWGKSIDDPYTDLTVLNTNIRGAHPRSLYNILVGDNGAALYATGRAGNLNNPRTYSNITVPVKICEVVVKRNATTNVIENAFLNWENNYVADDILNYARHDELGDRQTFTTRMVQRVDLCEPHNIYDDVQTVGGAWYDNREIDYPNGLAYTTGNAEPSSYDPATKLQGEYRWAKGTNVYYHAYVRRYDHSFYLKDSQFRVKFLRPINLDTINVTFVDASLSIPTASTGYIARLDEFAEKLTDWRNKSFYAGDYVDGIASDGRDYFRYYGALVGNPAYPNNYGADPGEKMSGDMLPSHFVPFISHNYLSTDMHDGVINTNSLYDPSIAENYLDEYITTEPPLFNYIAPAVLGDKNDPNGPFGYIYYDNSRVTVGKFTIKIPVRLQYRWGYLWTYIIAKVDTTQGN